MYFNNLYTCIIPSRYFQWKENMNIVVLIVLISVDFCITLCFSAFVLIYFFKSETKYDLYPSNVYF